MQRRAKKIGWVLELEEEAAAAPFLDAWVQLKGGAVQILPFVKANAKWNVPLCPSSGQAPHVHATWPVSRLNNCTCYTRPDYIAAMLSIKRLLLCTC